MAATVVTGIASIFARATSQRRNQSARSLSPERAERSIPVQNARPWPLTMMARARVMPGARRGTIEVVYRVVVGGVQLLGACELEPADAVRAGR
jgi:hypothetical protein